MSVRPKAKTPEIVTEIEIRIQRKQRTFDLGPFKVTESPRHFDSMYSLYEVFANEVPVRRQISCPEIEDGWLGISTTVANADGYLTAEQVETLRQFLRSTPLR